MQSKSKLKYDNLSNQNNNSLSIKNISKNGKENINNSNSISFRNNNNFKKNYETNLKINSYKINIKPSNNFKNSNNLNKNIFINNQNSKKNKFNDDDEIIKLIISNNKDKNIKKKIEILKENNFDFSNLLNFEDNDSERNNENNLIKTFPENKIKNKLKNNNLTVSYNKNQKFLTTSKNFNKTQTKLSDKNRKLKLDTFEYFDKINGKKHINHNNKKKINDKKEKSKNKDNKDNKNNKDNLILKNFIIKKNNEIRLNSKKIKDREKKENIEKYNNLCKLEKYINLLNNKNKKGNYFQGKININRLNKSENNKKYYLKNYKPTN